MNGDGAVDVPNPVPPKRFPAVVIGACVGVALGSELGRAPPKRFDVGWLTGVDSA